MGRNRKTIVRVYSAWNYEREIEDLNLLSKEGWQLAHGGLFASSFVKNDSLRYIYQLDYQPRLENMGRYLETYREQGWEYVNNTLNGWYYFRKAYDPSLPLEEYEIFTDRASLKEMNGRWAEVAGGMIALFGIMLAIESFLCVTQPTLPRIALLTAVGVAFLTVVRGYAIMRNPEKSKVDRHDGVRLMIIFGAVIGGLLASTALLIARPDGDYYMSADYFNPISANRDDALQQNTFEIKYADNYYLGLDLEAESRVTFSIVDSDGIVVFEKTGNNIELDAKLRLNRGEYRVVLSDFAGGGLNIKYELD